MDEWKELRFKERVNKAIEEAKRILETDKTPRILGDVHHEYGDKYVFVETLSNEFIGAAERIFAEIGNDTETEGETVWHERVKIMKGWLENNPVTLRFMAEERCKLLRQESRVIETPAYVSGIKLSCFTPINTTSKEKTIVYDCYWQLATDYRAIAFPGTREEEAIVFASVSRAGVVATEGLREVIAPQAELLIHPPQDVNINWLVRHIDDGESFQIDRDDPRTKTPFNNPQIREMIEQVSSLKQWTIPVSRYFEVCFQKCPYRELQGTLRTQTTPESIFIPITPFVCTAAEAESVDASGSVESIFFDTRDKVRFSDRHRTTLQDKRVELQKRPELNLGTHLIEYPEAFRYALLTHFQLMADALIESIDYIESLTRAQLITAIGKVLTPMEFEMYMEYHCEKLFKNEYVPRMFSHVIRLADHFPEGTVSIGATNDRATPAQPIRMITRYVSQGHAMKIPLNAASNITFTGARYIHAHLNHWFEGESDMKLVLNARARAFSSFILAIGRIPVTDVFEPEMAMIIKNEDDLSIPLMFEKLPTPNEFKDAIASFSPEQQAFCHAYRSLQLNSTLFAVVIIQIKPHLEKLMNLPVDSLLKEIELSEHLQELFLEHQIPSDQLCYRGDPDVPLETKLNDVKGSVASIMEYIQSLKEVPFPKPSAGCLIIHVLGARELTGMDIRHMSDPFLSLKIGSQTFETVPIQRNLAPHWDEIFRYEMTEACPDIYITVWDDNTKLFMGESLIPLDSFKDVPFHLAKEHWFSFDRQRKGRKALRKMDIKQMNRRLRRRDWGAGPGKVLIRIGQKTTSSPVGTNFTAEDAEKILHGQGEKPSISSIGAGASMNSITSRPYNTRQMLKDGAFDHLSAGTRPSPSAPPLASISSIMIADAAPVTFEPLSDPLGGETAEKFCQEDYTKIPTELDGRYSVFDEDHAVRAALIKLGSEWTLTSKNLLRKEDSKTLGTKQQAVQKNKAFDLLDALSRSGSLQMEHVDLHLVVASSHSFHQSMMDTIVREDINPIHRVEKSLLIIASTIHKQPISDLIHPELLERISRTHPNLFNALQ